MPGRRARELCPKLIFTGGLATTATTVSNVGSFGITQGSLAATSNYALSYFGANLTVTAAPLAVTADAQSRLYGAVNPALTYVSSGLLNGDTLSGLLATPATTTSNVGSYAIAQGTLANSNYAISYTGANLAVTAAPLTVTADAQSRLYGAANPSLTYVSSGLLNGDTLSGGLATSAITTSSVGNFGITQGSLANSNYAISYTGANLAVTPAPLAVTADAQSRIYGAANPALTYVSSGLLNGDTLSGGLATTATTTSNVGSFGGSTNTSSRPFSSADTAKRSATSKMRCRRSNSMVSTSSLPASTLEKSRMSLTTLSRASADLMTLVA